MRFTKNWNNKLHCSYFTSIRKHTIEKEHFYNSKLNEIDDIYLDDSIYLQAILVKIEVLLLKEIPDVLKIIDVGTLHYSNIFAQFNLKEDDKVILLLYKKD